MANNILCTDDSPTIRLLVKKTLEQAGYTVDEADDGTTGLEKTKSNLYKMLIVDVNMPKMNGFDFVAEVKKNPKYNGVPIVFLTTESAEQKKELGKSLGVSGWMVKPFEPDGLLKIVKMLAG